MGAIEACRGARCWSADQGGEGHYAAQGGDLQYGVFGNLPNMFAGQPKCRRVRSAARFSDVGLLRRRRCHCARKLWYGRSLHVAYSCAAAFYVASCCPATSP